ncbi:MAG: phosphoserine phosphatase SerB [Leptospiraceae bacterium]|nr:phosphoserine phosphatase SerB [Leptospiraceae bacterium]
MSSMFILYSKNPSFQEMLGLKKILERKIFDCYCYYYTSEAQLSIEEIKLILNQARSFRCDAIFVNQLLNPKQESLFVFDMDSTLIQQEVIDEIARECGVYEQVSKITEEAMQGLWNFEESLRKRCALLKGVKEDVFEKVYNKLTLNVGVQKFLENIKDYPAKIAVLSGGFVPILQRFANDFKIHEFRANTLEIHNGKLTGNVVGEIIDSEKKAKYLLEISKKYNIPKTQVVAVGDGANDKKMIELAGIGIGFHAKEGLKKQILNYIDLFGLEVLLSLFE